ncbi:cell division protein ZapA [Chitinophagales bacterium]|nr:cell division protein ZapA [Chitinophagales bacterium]
MNKDLEHIEVKIGNHNFGLKVGAEEKELVLRAVDYTNRKLIHLQSTYQAENKADYLAMVSLQMAIDVLKTTDELHTAGSIEQSLKELEERIVKRGK